MKVDLAGISVMLAMPAHRDLPWQTVRSMVETQSLMQAKGIPFEISLQVGGSAVTAARSKTVHAFLKTDRNRIFWVDSDIAWKADDFLRLVVLSAVMPVVVAAYPAKRDPPVFLLNVKPDAELETNEYGCVAIGGLGLGFAIMRRDMIEALAEKAPKLRFPDTGEPVAHLFREDWEDGDFRGEDVAFFADIRGLGHKVWLDPSVQLGHVGAKAYSADISTLFNLSGDSNATSCANPAERADCLGLSGR